MPSVNISGNGVQNLRALQDLLQGGRVDDNIRGRKLPDGSIQLYTKASGTSRFGILSKLASYESRALAREGIRQIFGQHAKETGTEVTATVRRAVDPGFARDVKAGALSLLITASKARSIDAARPEMRGTGLADLGVPRSVLREKVAQALQVVVMGGDQARVGSDLGEFLGAALMRTGPDAATRDAFSLSTGEAFKDELAGLIDEAGFEADRSLLDIAFKSASFSVARNRLDGDELSIGDRTYKREKEIGSGGGGIVHRFVNVSDPGDRIAVKVARRAEPGEMLDEIRSHARAQGEGHGNVLDFKGGVVCADGHLGMAMELCPLGDMGGALEALDGASERGEITADQCLAAKLTLLQDAMKGIAVIQGNGLEHRDFKPGNVFIAEDGTARLADFGEARTTDDYRWRDDGALSPYYASPEAFSFDRRQAEVGAALGLMTQADRALIQPDSLGTRQLPANEDHAPARLDEGSSPAAPKAVMRPEASSSLGVNPMRQGMDALLRKQLPHLGAEERDALLAQHNQGFRQEATGERLQEGKRDAYAVGMTAYEALHGIPKFAFAVQFYQQYKTDPDFKLIGDPTRDAARPSGRSSGQEELLGALVNEMTTLDMGKRKGITQALDHAVFKSSGIGAPETRDVIKSAIKDGMERKAAAVVGSVGAAPKAPAQGGISPVAASGGAPRPTLAQPAPTPSLADQLRSQLDDERFLTR